VQESKQVVREFKSGPSRKSKGESLIKRRGGLAPQEEVKRFHSKEMLYPYLVLYFTWCSIRKIPL